MSTKPLPVDRAPFAGVSGCAARPLLDVKNALAQIGLNLLHRRVRRSVIQEVGENTLLNQVCNNLPNDVLFIGRGDHRDGAEVLFQAWGLARIIRD